MKKNKKSAKFQKNSKEQAPKASKVEEAPIKITADTTAVMTIKLPGAIKQIIWDAKGNSRIIYQDCVEQRNINHDTLVAWAEDTAKPHGFQGDWKHLGKVARCRANAAVEGGTLEFIN